jgi:hypothetical protein
MCYSAEYTAHLASGVWGGGTSRFGLETGSGEVVKTIQI